LNENKVAQHKFQRRGDAFMQNWGLLIVIVGVLVANLPAVMAQWRTDRPGFIKTLWLMGIYALYVALGIVLLLLLAPRQPGETKALWLTGVTAGSSTARLA
jgi:hypothetical protein